MPICYKSMIEFSQYVDKDNIKISPKQVSEEVVPKERYFMYVPYKKRMSVPVTTVIMYNPSKAGLKDKKERVLSDFTVYNILQYLYHQDGYKAVCIMNLF